MKDSRFAYLVPVVGAVALPVVGLMVYAGLLTGRWGSLLACTPAIVVTIGVVSAISSGVFLFGSEEDETPEEAARPDGLALFDRFGSWIEHLVRRVAIGLHVRHIGH